MDVHPNSGNKQALVDKFQAKIPEGTAGILSVHVNNNAHITVTVSGSTASLGNIITSASELSDIDNFYSDNNILDANDATAI